MRLLERLVEAFTDRPAVSGARLVVIAFGETEGSAYISEINLNELIPLVEKWCSDARAAEQEKEKGTGLVH